MTLGSRYKGPFVKVQHIGYTPILLLVWQWLKAGFSVMQLTYFYAAVGCQNKQIGFPWTLWLFWFLAWGASINYRRGGTKNFGRKWPRVFSDPPYLFKLTERSLILSEAPWTEFFWGGNPPNDFFFRLAPRLPQMINGGPLRPLL